MQQSHGKGIESLIPKKINRVKEESASRRENKKEAIFSIEIEKIKPNPYQPRKEFDQNGLQSLAESIKDYGILQPLLVTRIEDKEKKEIEYQLVAGERRLLAAKMAGFARVPVIIQEASLKEKLEVSLIENVQRLDLNPLEKAEAFQQLRDEFNFSQKEIARLVGKSREAVANTLRLLELPNEIKQALREEKITEGHAKAILGVKDEKKQNVVSAKVIKDGLNVRETESLVQKIGVWKPAPRSIFPEKGIRAELLNLEEKIKRLIGVNTLKLKIESGKPYLTIFFNSKKELEDLFKRLSR
jgi:ParB family chromosome partitioning protein